jgi:hypothetical protein
MDDLVKHGLGWVDETGKRQMAKCKWQEPVQMAKCKQPMAKSQWQKKLTQLAYRRTEQRPVVRCRERGLVGVRRLLKVQDGRVEFQRGNFLRRGHAATAGTGTERGTEIGAVLV